MTGFYSETDAPNPAGALPFHVGHHWRRVGDPCRSAVTFAQLRFAAHPMKTRILISAFLAVLLICAGCGSQPGQQTVDRVRSEVATILKKDSAQIDVAKPLVAQGADELDIVEIVNL